MNLEAALRYLYSHFVLRDLVAKITPGALLLLAVVAAITNEAPETLVRGLSGIHSVVIVLLLAAAWIAGFIAQGLMDGLKWLLHGPPLGGGFLPRDDWVDLVANRTTLNPERSRQPERLAIIKEATGNFATSAALSALLIAYNPEVSHAEWWRVAAPVAFVILGHLHYDHQCRELTMQHQFQPLSAPLPPDPCVAPLRVVTVLSGVALLVVSFLLATFP